MEILCLLLVTERFGNPSTILELKVVPVTVVIELVETP